MKLPLVLSLAVALAGCGTSSNPAPAPVSAKLPVWKVTPGQPTYYINSVAVSGDGTRTIGGTFFHSYGAESDASQTGTFGTYCYDQKGNQLWKNEFVGWQGVYWVDVATNGAYAASGGWFSQTPTYAGFVRAFDANTGQQLLDARTNARVNQVALSSDGTWLISAAESLKLFQLVKGAYQLRNEYPAPPMTSGSNYFVSAALSADGSTVVTADYAGHILLLSTSGGAFALTQQWSLPSAYSHMVRITPDGNTFVCGGPSGSFYLFNRSQFITTGQPTATYQTGQSGSVYSVAVADDGSAFVGVMNYQSTAGMVYYVAKSSTGYALKWQYQTAHNPNCAWLNLRRGLLAVSDGHPDGTPGAFYLLNSANGTLRWQYQTGNMSWPIMISQNGAAIAAGSDDASMYYFTP